MQRVLAEATVMRFPAVLVSFLVAAMSFGSRQPMEALQIRSKAFSYTLDAKTLISKSWKNFDAHSQLSIGDHAEVEIETGEDPAKPTRVKLVPVGTPDLSPDGSKALLHMASDDESLKITVLLEADSSWPIMHKSVEITNATQQPIRLLNLVLGRIPCDGAKTEGGERGFPLYLNGQYFVSITHPAGYSHIEGNDIVLRQYPGVKIKPGKTFKSMEAIYGVAKPEKARPLFVDYVRSRMCRVKYGQDKPYAILESFGGQQAGNFHNEFEIGISESYLRDHLSDIATSQRDNGVQFDFYSLEFWHDRAGDLTTFHRQNFPNGFGPVRDEILHLGMQPALWIDSGGLPWWSIDLNPEVKNCYTHADGTGEFCRASEPISQIYKDAYLRQMRDNKVGLVKFDNLGYDGRSPVCNNPNHEHLPGPFYSTEAIYDSVIDFLETLRQANPKIFIMLYWGYRSPWWLQWRDTYFECGAPIEGASPAQYPTPFARDSVTQRLDQAQRTIQDTPWLGKDSLGVWLSNWPWNSCVGKDRWQEGAIMDMGRGGLLFQLWTDEHFLTPPERTQVATFIDLLKSNPDCFRNSRFILGNANKQEPYGYSCSDGKRAFLCINNATLTDRSVTVKLDETIGLPNQPNWDVYRWYPHPAALRISGPKRRRTVSMDFRPYEVALLEVVPAGAGPSLGRSFEVEDDSHFSREKSLQLSGRREYEKPDGVPFGYWTRLKPIHAQSEKGATLKIEADYSMVASGLNPAREVYSIIAETHAITVNGIMLEALDDPSLPSLGPGRAEDGNFALVNLRVQVAPIGHMNQLVDVKLKSAKADFFQTSNGGWPPEAIIDDDPKTGWSIHPYVGESHAVTFELETPLHLSDGAVLVFTMTQFERGLSLGRFRLSTSDNSAITFPREYQRHTVSETYRIPPSKTGGLFFLEGKKLQEPFKVKLDDQDVSLTPVWAPDANWNCPWIAWRLRLSPSTLSRAVEVRVIQSRTLWPRIRALYLPD